MKTMLGVKLLLFAEAVNYTVLKGDGVAVILKDEKCGGKVIFRGRRTYEGNLRTAVAWCENMASAKELCAVSILARNIQVPIIEGIVEVPACLA